MQLSPHDYLKLTLDPIGQHLDGMGTPHLIVGFLPGPGALHLTCNAAPKDRARAVRQVAQALNDYAAELERKPLSIILPAGMTQ